MTDQTLARTCQWCGGPIPSTRRRDARYCTEPHRKAAEDARRHDRYPDRIAAMRERDRSGRERDRGKRHRSPLVLAYNAALSRDPCSYCGGPAGETDHIVPRSEAGGNTGLDHAIPELENLTAACADCNRAKGGTPLLLYLATR